MQCFPWTFEVWLSAESLCNFSPEFFFFGQVGNVVSESAVCFTLLEKILNFCLSGRRQLRLHQKMIICRSKSQFLSNVQRSSPCFLLPRTPPLRHTQVIFTLFFTFTRRIFFKDVLHCCTEELRTSLGWHECKWWQNFNFYLSLTFLKRERLFLYLLLYKVLTAVMSARVLQITVSERNDFYDSKTCKG